MILGLSSFTYGWGVEAAGKGLPGGVDEAVLLERTLKFGLGCLQLGDNLPLHTIGSERLEGLRHTARLNNIRLEVGARGLTRTNLETYLDLARYLSAPLLRFVIDDTGYAPDIKTVLGVLRDVKPRLENAGVVLGIENHDRFKSRDLARLISSVDSEFVGICLDCANSIGAGEGLEQVAAVLAPFTVNLHIKDFSARRLPHKMGFIIEGAAFGNGLLDLPYLLDELHRYGRCRSAVFEQWVPPEADPSITTAKEEKWAEDGINSLKECSGFRLKA